MASFVCGLPRDGCEGSLEESVVDDVTLAVFSFDDPVAGIGFALAAVSEDGSGVGTLCCVDQKGPASTKGVHSILLRACTACRSYLTP